MRETKCPDTSDKWWSNVRTAETPNVKDAVNTNTMVKLLTKEMWLTIYCDFIWCDKFFSSLRVNRINPWVVPLESCDCKESSAVVPQNFVLVNFLIYLNFLIIHHSNITSFIEEKSKPHHRVRQSDGSSLSNCQVLHVLRRDHHCKEQSDNTGRSVLTESDIVSNKEGNLSAAVQFFVVIVFFCLHDSFTVNKPHKQICSSAETDFIIRLKVSNYYNKIFTNVVQNSLVLCRYSDSVHVNWMIPLKVSKPLTSQFIVIRWRVRYKDTSLMQIKMKLPMKNTTIHICNFMVVVGWLKNLVLVRVTCDGDPDKV